MEITPSKIGCYRYNHDGEEVRLKLTLNKEYNPSK